MILSEFCQIDVFRPALLWKLYLRVIINSSKDYNRAFAVVAARALIITEI